NTLDNDGNTIAGYGLIKDLTLENGDVAASIINANSSGNTLTLQTGHTISNESLGLMEATAGGTLEIKDSVTNASGGHLKALGGTIDVSAGGGVISNATATDGIVIDATGTLQFEVNTLELTGAGGVSLSGGTIQGNSSNTLDNDGNTIAGYGLIKDLTLENGDVAASIINANSSGNTLTLQTGHTISNESLGLMEATAGGTLEIKDSVTNTGSIV